MTQYIDLHYNEDLSIDNIAQHFNISQDIYHIILKVI